MISVTAKASIPLSAQQINLPKWFYSFTEAEFKKSSPANLGMNIKNNGGKGEFHNKVAVSGHLLLNHYLEDRSALNRLKLSSAKSQLFLFKLIPIKIRVSYELSIVPTSKNSAELICTSIGQYPKWLEVVSHLTWAKYFLQKHQDEETKYYAGDILQKIQKKRL